MKRIRRLWLSVGIATILVGIMLVLLASMLSMSMQIALAVYVAMAVILLASFYFLELFRVENQEEIEANLNEGMRNVLHDAKIGLLVYNETYDITWMSAYLKEKVGDFTNRSLYSWNSELRSIVEESMDQQILITDHTKYLVTKQKNANVLSFRDVSKEYDLEKKFIEDAVVVGLVNFDNYDEVSEIEDDLAYVNSTIRPSVYEYFRKHNLVYKTLRNNRVLLIMNEKQYEELLEDRFSILATVRKEAKKGDIEMTLSMAFARGSDDLLELDATASNLLEIAQTRGGDQVVARKIGEDAIFYGGSSEARGKRSKVRVRVYANTLRSLFQKASNVIICCHQEADSDCIGSAICLSAIAHNFVSEVCIITKSGGVENTVAEVLKQNISELEQRHSFVSESEAINRLRKDSLVIMVDHHSASQSNGSQLLKKADNIVIIDHHRRKADLDTQPVLVYIEAGASSASELTAEFLPYLLRRTPITPLEANLMYLGMIIDTNHFRVRAGERTFDVARNLRSFGADPAICEEWIREPYEKVKQVSRIVEAANLKEKGVAIACMDDKIYVRSIISQACDRILNMKEVKAGFVVARISEEDIAISARSDGSINVQIIMEKMKGGGHLTGAGVQRKEGTVEDLLQELESAIQEYFVEEEKENESHSIE